MKIIIKPINLVKNEPDLPSLTSASCLTRSPMRGSFPKAVIVGMEEGQLAGEGPEWRGFGRGATSSHTPASPKIDDDNPKIDTQILQTNSITRMGKPRAG